MRPRDPTSSPGVPPDERTLFEVGAFLGWVSVGSLMCSAAAAYRLRDAVPTEEPLHIWLALASAAFAPLAMCVLILRAAWRGLRWFASPPHWSHMSTLVLWIGALFVSLSVWANALQATTHNAALAGVTFAFGASGLAVGIGMLCNRFIGNLKNASRGLRVAAALLAVAVTITALARSGVRHAAVSSGPTLAVATDVVLFSAGVLAVARAPLHVRLAGSLAGAFAALVMLILGLSGLQSGPVNAAIRARAQAFAPMAALVPST